MKTGIYMLSLTALFAGAAMAADDAHRVISEGTYSESQYATETNVASGGSSLTINGGTFNLSTTDTAQKNLYGGGSAGSTIVGDTSFVFNGGDIVNISGWTHSFYGASAENSLVKGNSTVEINSGNISGTDLQRSGIFGGAGAGSTVEGDVSVNINGGTITGMTVFGGGDGAVPCNDVNGTYGAYLNKADTSYVKGNVSVNIGKDATVYYVSAGGRGYNVIEGNTTLTIDGTIKAPGGGQAINFGTSRVGVIKGSATAYINSGATIEKNVAVYLNGEIHGNNVNYNEDGSVASVKDASKNVVSLYIDGTTIDSSVQASGDDWSNRAVLYGSSLIDAKDSTITKMRGAFGTNTVVHGNTNIELSNTTITDKIYVGSDTATIKGNANLVANGGSINEIYGSYGTADTRGVVGGNLNVSLKDTAVKNIYLAGKGNALLEGNATLTLTGNTSVSGIISAGGKEVSGFAPEIKGDSVLALGSTTDAYTGTIAATIADFDRIEISNSETNVAFKNAFTVSVLQVAAQSKATLADGTDFSKLVLSFDSDFTQGDTSSVDLEAIFGSSTSVVLSALQEEAGATLTVKDGSGQEWSLASKDFSDNTLSFVIGSQIPEPATYAAIFGAMALAFAAYRRRK